MLTSKTLLLQLLSQLFREELLGIQKRHAIVFPINQLFYVSVQERREGYELKFLKGYDLSSVITLEIQLAFKLVFQKIHEGKLVNVF